MSASSVHADAFFREPGPDGSVWTIEDDEGVPAPRGTDGARAMPFWPRESRARRVIENVLAYAGFRTREIPRAEFESRWLPGLSTDGLLIGLNWAGRPASTRRSQTSPLG